MRTELLSSLRKTYDTRTLGCQYWHVFLNVGDDIILHRTLDIDDDLDLNKWHVTFKVLMLFDRDRDPAHNVTLAETTAAMRLDSLTPPIFAICA